MTAQDQKALKKQSYTFYLKEKMRICAIFNVSRVK